MSSNPITTSGKNPTNYLAILAFLIAIIGLFFPRPSTTTGNAGQPQSTLNTIKENKVMRIGYEGYPPYTIEDPNTGKLSGLSVEMAEYIAKEIDCKIEWIKTNPDTKISDIQTGKFDFMIEPIYRTIPRALNVTFTRPYSYFGYAAAIVKKGDKRFNSIEDVNTKGITVSVRLGYTDQTFAEQNLPLAEIKAMKADDITQVFQDVVSGNSDIALSDLEQVKAFSKEHPDLVDALFVENPPALVPAGFMIKQGDFILYNFLNTTIDYMESNGIIEQLNKKYSVSAFQEKKILKSSE